MLKTIHAAFEAPAKVSKRCHHCRKPVVVGQPVFLRQVSRWFIGPHGEGISPAKWQAYHPACAAQAFGPDYLAAHQKEV